MEDVGTINPPAQPTRKVLVIRQVTTPQDLRDFINFPYGLYRGNPQTLEKERTGVDPQ